MDGASRLAVRRRSSLPEGSVDRRSLRREAPGVVVAGPPVEAEDPALDFRDRTLAGRQGRLQPVRQRTVAVGAGERRGDGKCVLLRIAAFSGAEGWAPK